MQWEELGVHCSDDQNQQGFQHAQAMHALHDQVENYCNVWREVRIDVRAVETCDHEVSEQHHQPFGMFLFCLST